MSDRALNKAIEFAKLLKAEIIILHILDDKLIPSKAIMSFLPYDSSSPSDKAFDYAVKFTVSIKDNMHVINGS